MRYSLFAITALATIGIALPSLAQTLAATDMMIDGRIEDEKEAENLSGIACATDRQCIIIGDEKEYARLITLSECQVKPNDAVYLLPGPAGSDAAESDAEGIAYSDGAYYLIGSHSLSKNGEVRPARHHLFKINVDRTSGLPSDLGQSGKTSASVTSTSLDPYIQLDPWLVGKLGIAPGEGKHGVNIEGIAVSGNDIFVGFRGPAEGGQARLWKMSLTKLFGEEPQKPQRFLPPLGHNQGIRDIATMQGGLLILSGPEMRADAAKPRFYFWNSSTGTTICLGQLGSESAKVTDSLEGITVLSETAEHYIMITVSGVPRDPKLMEEGKYRHDGKMRRVTIPKSRMAISAGKNSVCQRDRDLSHIFT